MEYLRRISSSNTRSNKRRLEEYDSSKSSDGTRSKKRKREGKEIAFSERIWRDSIRAKEELERGLRAADKQDEKVRNYCLEHEEDLRRLKASPIFKKFCICLRSFDNNLGAAKKHL